MKKVFLGVSFLIMATITCTFWSSCKKDEIKGKIYGTVTDFATGEPVGNANVKLQPSGETTLTGSDGTYEFKDLDDGKYTLKLSKAEYNDLDDDYVIELEAGKTVKRDVQMKKQIASLQVTDMAGNDITELDFGMEESITTKSFNIFNNGTLNITCEITYSCVWITSVSNITNPITPGQTVTVTVSIDRMRLSAGDNSTNLSIVSNNGSNEVRVKAIGTDQPTVTTANVSNVTASSATCGGNVTADGGSYVTERGICWATTNAPTTSNSHIAMGQGTGTFTCNMTDLEPNNVYYVRAYATNSKGTSYGEQKQFTTNNGLPTVVITNLTAATATSATCSGNITNNGGFSVTDKGLVWSTTQYPTLNDNHISLGSGNGPFVGSINDLSDGITYYVRAYATNSQGTAYSEQQSFSIDLEYLALPTFTYNGHTYRVAPDPHTTCTEYMSWTQANDYCENLTAYGYSDWRMPTLSELETMNSNRSSIGGFIESTYNSDNGYRYISLYHSSNVCNNYHNIVNWSDGSSGCWQYSGGFHEDPNYTWYYFCHTRPIRVEN